MRLQGLFWIDLIKLKMLHAFKQPKEVPLTVPQFHPLLQNQQEPVKEAAHQVLSKPNTVIS